MQWCAMCIFKIFLFLFLRFYNFIKGKCTYIQYFLRRLRPLFLYLTQELVQIFITFNINDVSLFKQANKCAKRIVLIFYIYVLKLKQSQPSFSHWFLAVFSVSYATDFFIHSLNRFVLKKATDALLVFFNEVLFSFLAYTNIPFKCL